MPAPGFKSITVKDDVYDYFYKEWLKVKDKYALEHGITSFSGFISKRLYDLIQQEKKHTRK